MKRSEYDILLHRRDVLVRKIQAYEKLRKAINDLADQFLDDVYALEALNAVDRTIFNQLLFMYDGLRKLDEQIKKAAAVGAQK